MHGYAHTFDWINIAWEYWNNPIKYNVQYNYPYESNRELWEAYVGLLRQARYIKCLSHDRLKLESYVVLYPNMAGIDEDYNGYCWGAHTGDAGVLVDWEYRCVTYNWDAIVTGVSECPPNGFVQAETFDTYLDRVLLANYFNLHKGITLWGPHSFY
jgi:hypothetical protein